MRTSALTGVAALATALGVLLSGCGPTKAVDGTPVAAPSTSGRTSAPAPAQPDEGTPGSYETIASYISQNGIQETPVKAGDPGAPTIDLPYPQGWEDAGPETPDWAYGATVYRGPEAAEYTPSIVALISKLSGDVDPAKIIELAPGELQNLPGYEAITDGTTSQLSGFDAYQLAGTWEQDGLRKFVAQKTVVIPGSDGLYVLQLNADGLADQADILSAATDVIDAETVITP
ncbi:LpqN/LpqT family lipoprotein [Mycolicibacterium neoaurum]|uniref:LpqN/LpqT family lipoprotein n=1 Tax=Mycolicibacterium neoaurum TaxID=1795 RepID=UPI002673839A|nr:LpqN/LpqT family lipoprotein [Mycolicibacterium neoaurum]MDO3400032.1 LpqN/LpqT family lipoprotein [Mycolicibacterium neoaurum]